MLERYLTTFYRDTNCVEKPDFSESIGDFCLGLLRIGCGKTLSVAVIQKEGASKIAFTEAKLPTTVKAAAIGLLILILPITIFLIVIGCQATANSESHQSVFTQFKFTASTEKTECSNNSLERNKNKTLQQRFGPTQAARIREDRMRMLSERERHTNMSLESIF